MRSPGPGRVWRIGDAGAAAFAQRFYAGLETRAAAESLAVAQREMGRDPQYGSPFYWAAYQLFGQSERVPDPHTSVEASVQRK